HYTADDFDSSLATLTDKNVSSHYLIPASHVGSFEKGYELDALIIDDTSLFDLNERSLEERLERWLYVGDDRHIIERYVAGRVVPSPKG
ncbi:MAG: hypothetical protein E6953_08420, partial [Veillonella sp.]|nr:hypothetical protein [Veillonella sp.]